MIETDKTQLTNLLRKYGFKTLIKHIFDLSAEDDKIDIRG